MRRHHTSLAFLVGLIGLTTAAGVSSQTPQGDEFKANTVTSSWQGDPAVGADSFGRFVVVWVSYDGRDGSASTLVGQRFASNGTALGAEFQVNSYTTGYQFDPSLGVAPNGDFVVVWTNRQSYAVTNPKPLLAQRYASDGTKLGAEFQISPSSPYPYQYWPSVDTDANGNFVVVWSAYNFTKTGNTIFGRRFASDGTPQGPEFQINEPNDEYLWTTSVAVDDGGEFVVAWASPGIVGSAGLFGQRFASDGTKLGSEFDINSYTSGNVQFPSVANDADGDFVVVWQEYDGQDGDHSGIFGQLFAADGSSVGGEFQVNTYTTTYQYMPSVAMDATGNFVVTWSSWYGQDGDSGGIFAQSFSADGSAWGEEFQVNSVTTGGQWQPSIGMDIDGDFVVAWGGTDDGSDSGVFGQRFLSGLGDELAVDFGTVGPGLWYYDDTLTSLSGLDPAEAPVAWGDKLAVSFAGSGLYLYDSGGWRRLSAWEPYDVVAWGDKLAVSFAGNGLYLYQSSGWTRLTTWEPYGVVAWGDKLAVSFSGSGLFLYDSGGWTRLSTWEPYDVVAWGSNLAVSFAGSGLYLYDSGGWRRLSAWEPYDVVAWGSNLAVSFAGSGLYLYDTTAWARVTTWEPDDVVAWGDDLAVSFPGSGLYLYDAAGWARLTTWDTVHMDGMADDLAVAFGSGNGLWLYEAAGGWSRISTMDSEGLTAVNLSP